jgi:hypothetical protein
MLATLCSNPAVTNAVIGGTIARMRSVVERALNVSHNARRTSVLHKMPSTTACPKSSPTFALAVASAVAPIAPSPNMYCPLANTSPAVDTAPLKLPAYTTSQFFRSSLCTDTPAGPRHHNERVAREHSAPPTITRISPKENASPASRRPSPYGMVELPPVSTVVENIAPSAIKAPASTARTNVSRPRIHALLSPTCSARPAISRGNSASNERGAIVALTRLLGRPHDVDLSSNFDLARLYR